MKIRQFVSSYSASLTCIAGLLLANAAYLTHDFFGWVVTLGFFLLVPGYLLLNCLKHGIKSKWEIGSISLSISLLMLMGAGLALNSLHVLGLHRPLNTLNIFATLDIITLVLLAFTRNKLATWHRPKLRATAEQIVVFVLLTLLPAFAVGGAIRLNNGASDVLTMVLFAAIPLLFMWMVCRRKQLEALFPYAVAMFGMSVLFTNSLRGWFITGHDIQHEFKVFQTTINNGFWSTANPKGDPYNACLSLTILPTIIAKITTISAPYVYKAVFQIVFAFGLVPIYLFTKRLSSAWIALTGALVFISFPTFVNDMPFLNRQEMAFVFFAALMLATFSNMARRPKAILTVFTLLGLILSHYSSGYVTIGLLAFSWLFFKILTYRRSGWQPFALPVLSLPIITVALLFTFLWNAQVTATTSNLSQSVTGLLEAQAGASGVSYSILSPHTLSPNVVLAEHAGSNADQVHYVPPANLPTTSIGKAVSRTVSVTSLNSLIRAFSAKILQLLLLIGVIILLIRHLRLKSARETYFWALVLSCVVALALITLLPELSVGYSVNRLFQQTLIITALPIILSTELLLGFARRYKVYLVSLFFAFLFLDLSGFVPQLLGGYPPQLPLNNSGDYYDMYYTHGSERASYSWLMSNSDGEKVTMDFYARGRLTAYLPARAWLVDPLSTQAKDSTYIYQDYANEQSGLYADYLGGDTLEYSYPDLTQDASPVYANQSSRVFERTGTGASNR